MTGSGVFRKICGRTAAHLLAAVMIFACGLSAAESVYVEKNLTEKIGEKNLTFAVTFDKWNSKADFARGSKKSSLPDTNLMMRMENGFDNQQCFRPEGAESLYYDILKNASVKEGTLSFWVKTVDFVPGSRTTNGVSRKNIALGQLVFCEEADSEFVFSGGKAMIPEHIIRRSRTYNGDVPVGKRLCMLTMYEYEGLINFEWWCTGKPFNCNPSDTISFRRVPKSLKQNQWFLLTITWDMQKTAAYINGEQIGAGNFPDKFRMRSGFTVRSGYIGVKRLFYGDRNKWKVSVDDFRIWNRAFAPAEVKNRYIRLLKNPGSLQLTSYELKLNGVDTGTRESMNQLEAEFDFSALPEDLAKNLSEGRLTVDYRLTGPDGKTAAAGSWKMSEKLCCRMIPEITVAGKYTLTTSIGGKHRITAEIVRPDLSFAYNGLADEDEVPELWKDYRFSGRTVTLWNRVYRFGDGPLPVSIRIKGKELFLQPPELRLDQRKITWKPGKTEHTVRTVTYTGTGTARDLTVDYRTTVEFDGMINFEWTVNGRPEISSMKLDWQVAPEFRRFFMSPMLRDPQKSEFADTFNHVSNEGSMLWLVSPHNGGFAFTVEHDANWFYDEEKPVFFTNREQGRCRAEYITRKVRMPSDKVSYHALFVATPMRPLPKKNRMICMAKDLRMYNGGGAGGINQVGTYLPHPYDFEYRMRKEPPMSGVCYGLANALTSDNACVKYFRKYWAIPHAPSTQMTWVKPVAPGKYERVRNPLIMLCNRTSFQDYLINNQKTLYEHPYGDRIAVTYYDYAGNWMCSNADHGCQFKDAFGRRISSREILTKRRLVQRTVALAHKYGRTVMCHHQCWFFPFMCGMADYWYPGEQYEALVHRSIWAYTDAIDELYQSEYNRDVLGVGVVFLPALSYADMGQKVRPTLENPVYTESMVSMLGLHDVESDCGYCMREVFYRYWDILKKYKVDDEKNVRCHLYFEQSGERRVKSSSPHVRVTWYECPGARYLLFLQNRTSRSQEAEIDVSSFAPGNYAAREEYFGKDIRVRKGRFTIRLDRRSFAMVGLPPASFYPHQDNMERPWPFYLNNRSDTVFSRSETGGTGGSPCLMQIQKDSRAEHFYRDFFPLERGKRYLIRIQARQDGRKPEGFLMSVDGFRDFHQVASGRPAKFGTAREWATLFYEVDIPDKEPWNRANRIRIMFTGRGQNCRTFFDDLRIETAPMTE